MFSGIVETTARVVSIEANAGNIDLTLRLPFVNELKVDQSLAHNGVCLTVVRKTTDTYTVTAIQETLDRSNLGSLRPGDEVNIERAMQLGSRLDGHIVQGHVDCTARCTEVAEQDGSHVFTFVHPVSPTDREQGYFTVEKGSVTVNGVSLTVCRPTRNSFQVCIIPYTFEHTNFHDIRPGNEVNIEFDILGKYIARMQRID